MQHTYGTKIGTIKYLAGEISISLITLATPSSPLPATQPAYITSASSIHMLAVAATRSHNKTKERLRRHMNIK